MRDRIRLLERSAYLRYQREQGLRLEQDWGIDSTEQVIGTHDNGFEGG